TTVNLSALATNIGTDIDLIDLEVCIVPSYVSSMVFDPVDGSVTDTKYQIVQDAVSKRITISAPEAELGEVISVTR
ncbi:hypothetical protein KJ671_02865, partial [Patescibacteria group bacterium]|nr:hypothetical protein [Patescibacteria group bacterium]